MDWLAPLLLSVAGTLLVVVSILGNIIVTNQPNEIQIQPKAQQGIR
jgi:hypothetical protein